MPLFFRWGEPVELNVSFVVVIVSYFLFPLSEVHYWFPMGKSNDEKKKGKRAVRYSPLPLRRNKISFSVFVLCSAFFAYWSCSYCCGWWRWNERVKEKDSAGRDMPHATGDVWRTEREKERKMTLTIRSAIERGKKREKVKRLDRNEEDKEREREKLYQSKSRTNEW